MDYWSTPNPIWEQVAADYERETRERTMLVVVAVVVVVWLAGGAR